MTIAAQLALREVPEARRRNRADHYWRLIETATGRRRLRHAADYIKAMLADQPPDVVEQAVRAIENIIHPIPEGK